MTEAQCIKNLYQLAESCPQEDFQVYAFEELHRLIQFDSAVWGEGAILSDTLHALRGNLYNLPDEYTQEYNDIKHLNPLGAFLVQGNGVTVMAHIDDNSTGVDDAFKAYIRKYDVPKMLQTNSSHDSGLFMYTIALWRKRDKDPFSETERSIKERLTPHLLESFRHCRRFDIQRKLIQRWEMNRALATCNQDGILYDADDDFIELVRADWPQWQGAKLPAALIQKLFDTAIFRTENLFYRSTLLGNLYLLVVAPLNSLQLLSDREFEIAYIYANGATSREVAHTLSISPITVKNHMAKVYEKLNLDSKDKLKRLFISHE